MKLAFLFFCLMASTGTWAQTGNLLQSQMQDLVHWAQDPEWQNLLHMQKTWRGEKSKIHGGGFFLDPEGATNSLAELQTTYRLMFQSSPEIQTQTQCRFLARRDFFFRQNSNLKERIQICQLSQEWLQRLNATKISLIFASGYMNSAASSFGHTFLKLQNPENAKGQELLDYGINFAARTQNITGALYAWYGLLGYFPGNFAMMPYHQMIQEYTNLEGRDLWEYELNFSAEEVQRILFHLLELEGTYVDYYFLDDNCSFLILQALEIARPGLQLAPADEFFVIPLDTVKKTQALVTEIRYRPSLETEWRQRRQKLSRDQKNQILHLQPTTSSNELKAMNLQTLSAASYGIALKQFDDHQKWKDLNYRLQSEIAQRGPQSDPFVLQRPAQSPDLGHHSSSVEVGFSDQKDSSAIVGLRLAFHDALSRDVGVPPFSHLEVLGFQWRATELQQVRPVRYRLLETLSTRAISEFEKPISWGVTVGGDSKNGSSMQNHILGRFGYSFDPVTDKVRWSHLAVTGLSQNLASDFQLVYGYDTRLWILWNEKLRSLVQCEWTWFPSELESRLQLQQALDLTEQLELRAGWGSLNQGDERTIEKRVSLFWNFLL